MADWIRILFGIIGRTPPGMRQVVGFGDRSTRRDTFGGEFGVCHCNQWELFGVHVLQHRGPLPKLLWADLLNALSDIPVQYLHFLCVATIVH